jgi:hypothetical protein
VPETYFIRGADCWGWGTWKRGWNLFEQNGRQLLKTILENNLSLDFDFGGKVRYTEMLAAQVVGMIDSWAIRWHASAFIKNKLTLYPAKSLVQNIGLGRGDATHTKSVSTLNFVTASNEPVTIERIPLKELNSIRRAFANALR